MLPATPGLFVDGLGAIPTPLLEEQAEKLVVLCKKSPSGHNQEAKMDESVRKSWQLQPDLVQFRHPQWQSGMEKLTKLIAERLGYVDVPLQCVLYKLLVYGEGGHFLKHQDTEKENGMIATLVVQPPSAHEGGDLVVYRGGETTYRHEFGKASGMAAFLPHYAVHYADAEHALEEVTKGYRLVLVYSICLPKTMRHLGKRVDKPLSEDLASAINSMDEEDDSFALLLDHEYTEKSLRYLGLGALKGADAATLHVLEGANALVSDDKKLLFFLAQLKHDVSWDDDGYECSEKEHAESVTWFSTAGEDLGRIRNFTAKLNLLNPDENTSCDLWVRHGKQTKEGGYTGNEGSTSVTTYSRVAIVAWLASRHFENAMTFMPLDVAVEALNAQKSVDGAALGKLLDVVTTRLETENSAKEYGEKSDVLSMTFCCVFCEVLVRAGDPGVVTRSFKSYCGSLGGVEGNETLAPYIAKVVRAFDWGDISEAITKSLGSDGTDSAEGCSAIELTLRVVARLDAGTAQQALLKMATEKATEMEDRDLFFAKYVGLLWDCVIRCGNSEVFDAFAKKLEGADPALLGLSVQYLSQYLSGVDEKDAKVALLASVRFKRIKWLKEQIEAMDKKFSWEMLDAEFGYSDEIQAFLRGPEVTMSTRRRGGRKIQGASSCPRRRGRMDAGGGASQLLVQSGSYRERRRRVRDDHENSRVVPRATEEAGAVQGGVA